MPDQRIDINAAAQNQASPSRIAVYVAAVGTTPRIDSGLRGVSTRKEHEHQSKRSATKILRKEKSAARITSRRQCAPSVGAATTKILFHRFAFLAKAWALEPETDLWTAMYTLMIGLNVESAESASKTVANRAAVMTGPFVRGELAHVFIPKEGHNG